MTIVNINNSFKNSNRATIKTPLSSFSADIADGDRIDVSEATPRIASDVTRAMNVVGYDFRTITLAGIIGCPGCFSYNEINTYLVSNTINNSYRLELESEDADIKIYSATIVNGLTTYIYDAGPCVEPATTHYSNLVISVTIRKADGGDLSVAEVTVVGSAAIWTMLIFNSSSFPCAKFPGQCARLGDVMENTYLDNCNDPSTYPFHAGTAIIT